MNGMLNVECRMLNERPDLTLPAWSTALPSIFSFSPWTLERDVPLEAYGPPGLEAMTQHLLAAGRKVGEIATRAGVPTVILTHQLWWSATGEQLVEEVRSTFAGRVISGRDLDAFDLRDLRR